VGSTTDVKAARTFRRLLAAPAADSISCLSATVADSARPWTGLLCLLLSVVAAWWIYVPAHELLHAAACSLSGGEVRKLTISPMYGGVLLSRWLVFVQPGSEYAGRLSDFSTGRSDLRYLAIDGAPYVLSIVLGVPLLHLATRRRSKLLAGPALVLALVPFLSLTGDYYEMGSIVVTRSVAPFDPPPEPWETPGGVMKLRSDDLPSLIGRIFQDGARFVGDVPGGALGTVAFVAISFSLGLGFALMTYSAGGIMSGWFFSLRRSEEEEILSG
jgi:hypothetical protein